MAVEQLAKLRKLAPATAVFMMGLPGHCGPCIVCEPEDATIRVANMVIG